MTKESQNDREKKACRYFGKARHVEKTCWKKSANLEEKVKRLEGDLVAMHLTSWPTHHFTFNIKTCQVLLAQAFQNEWVVNFACTHDMAKDTSLFSSLDTTIEKKIYMACDFTLETISNGDVSC